MIKEKSQTWAKFSAKLGAIFARLPFPPNYYTWLTLPVALIGLFATQRHHLFYGVLAFAIAGLLDIIDGALARHTQRASHAGAFLDGSLDRFIDFFLIYSYFWVPIQTPWLPVSHWICSAIFFALMPSFVVAYANHRRAVEDPEEKIIWRILNRGEMYLLMLAIPLAGMTNSTWAGYLLVVLVTLSLITTLQTLFATLYRARLPQ